MNRLSRKVRLGIIAAALFGMLASCIVAQDTLSGDFSKRPEIEKRLAAVRAETNALPASADPELRQRLQELEVICQFHLTALDVLTKAQAGRDAAAQALSAWRGFPQPPPYSILLQDEIRENLATLGTAQRAGEAQLRIFRSEIEGARDKLDSHQQAERQLAEAASIAKSPEARHSTNRAIIIEQLSSRYAAELLGRLSLRLQTQQAELDMIRLQIELADLKEKALEGKTIFSKKDLTDLQLAITREREEVLAQQVAASRQSLSPNPLLTWKIEFLDLKSDFWNTRFEAHGNKDPKIVKEALDTLAEHKARVDDWIEIAQLRISSGANSAFEVDPTKMQENLRQVAYLQRQIGFAIADLEGVHLSLPALDLIRSRLSALWNAELYLAEETEVVNGSKISTYRAVTVAKLARLVLILTVGWLILRFISRKIESIIARKAVISNAHAELVAKLVFGLGLALLVIYGLNTVRIPFTVFAFLGGALAIGVGFGTQTLLKNFISGIILIFERPLKVGDTVEIEGVTGSIRSIGMRASIITQCNGIDTIIPNSNLLENQVTNWTLNDTLLRHSLTVGVDYASPTREVSRALLAIAEDHGLVLAQPAPEVLFEEFGDKALVFRLLFWFDARKISRDTLTSELRYMIAKSFKDSGLIISCPQQDFKINPESALRIELAKPRQSSP